jgi:hypothetical protein
MITRDDEISRFCPEQYAWMDFKLVLLDTNGQHHKEIVVSGT